MNSYPAGFSSDEDEFDDFGFENERPKRNFFQHQNLTPDKKLIDAVCNNDVNATRKALDEGANIHHKSDYSMNHTPIMKAASFGCFEVMEYLISRGANVNDDFEMFNVIMCVCNSSLPDETVLLRCLNLLLDNGADPLATDWIGTTSLMNAVRRNKQLLAAKLLESGCSVNAADGEGWTPLFYAVQAGSIEMTKFLIDSGGKLNLFNRYGVTLWEHAASKNDEDLSALVTPKDLLETPDDTPDSKPHLCTSQFKLMMASVPKIGGRMFGFREDAVRFLRGIGLDNVASDMEKKKIQFAELMTWNEHDWIRAGIQLSYQLKKIDFSVRKYHEKEWGKNSNPKPCQVISKGNEAVELFAVVQFLLSSLRCAHINSTTSLYVLKNCEEKLTSDSIEKLDQTLNTCLIIKNQIRMLSGICREIDNPTLYPPDLIVSDRQLKYKISKFLIVDSFFLKMVIELLVYEWTSG